MQWNHQGSGTVQVTVDGNDIHFDEHFTLDNDLPCTDRKIWRFTPEGIVFRHWRQQRWQDIWLLVPADGDTRTRQPQGVPPTGGGAPSERNVPAQASSRPDDDAAPGSTALPPPRRLHLVARTPYHCPPDRYDGSLTRDGEDLRLRLSIVGPRKDEDMRYTYAVTGPASPAAHGPASPGWHRPRS